MALFQINQTKVKRLTAKDVRLEKDLQKLFEQNLEEILNISFLATEYSTSFGGRIDTLGIDKNGAPVIIEYKRSTNESVINQGLSYLRWLLDHKAEFESLCHDSKVETEIDWDSPRVICVAESYNKFDIDTADFLPINIELLRYRIYDDNILYLEPENYQRVKVATGGIVRKAKQDRESLITPQLQKTYTVEDHLRKPSESTKLLFLKLREAILAFDEEVSEEPRKHYIAYKLATNFADVIFFKDELRIALNLQSGQLSDPKNLATDFTKPKKGHWGNGDYEVKLRSDDELPYVLELIKQSYDLNK